MMSEMIDNGTEKVLPNCTTGGDSADSDGSLDGSLSYCAAPDDIIVPEQQYAQSDVIPQSEAQIGDERNANQSLDNSEREALDWLHGNSDEVGHAFQNEAGHLFRTEAGRCSDLKPAT